ncbi:MAG: aconitate hydratase AcnA [Coxiellaceae bacterium]|nr:aconitate hydratase AcnA [Coxiellaceae bacterium]
MSNSFQTKKSLSVHEKTIHYFSLPTLKEHGFKNIDQLPFSLKVLLENQLRHEDGGSVTSAEIHAFEDWVDNKRSDHEIAYYPARVLMQDFTGVPAVVDLAAMRNAVKALDGDANLINPLCRVDLVIDHSVQVDYFGTTTAFSDNVDVEMQRNKERYEFLKWGQQAFENSNIVPPGTGICHQVNLEYLAKTIWTQTHAGELMAYPDTLVGTDSHTTMINGLGVLGWGVGGIEAEAAMLGQPISMLIPEVIGFRLTGELKPGVTATDLVLRVVEELRLKGVVGKFVEFFGPGLIKLPLADRATLANMAPEYGATCGFFPIDEETIKYLKLSNRDAEQIAIVEAYAKAQGMWYDQDTPDPVFTDTIELDMADVEPSLAGPKRPQDRVSLQHMPEAAKAVLNNHDKLTEAQKTFPSEDDFSMHHGDIVIAAITSCTNTSNPSVMLAAGLLAQKAIEKGLTVKPWVKTSLAPGSKVVTSYLETTNLLVPLQEMGFDLVGYGCTTCIGNSGPLPDVVSNTIKENDIIACSVLSGNRNFEGRIHPLVQANWLASPPLVVAFAIAGNINIDLTKEPLGKTTTGEPIFLKDIWPSPEEVSDAVAQVNQAMFASQYANVFDGEPQWQSLAVTETPTYQWQEDSTYIRHAPFFEGMTATPPSCSNVEDAKILALLGDSVTTDHISPAGAIKSDSPAGQYLQSNGIQAKDFNSYGSRRGNHEVMMRGTFANIRIRNEMVPGIEGGFTKHASSKEPLPIYDAAMLYQKENTPLVVIAGKEYGTGSSRDWAAKGTLLLGVKAVIAESFERIHRSNLIGMGVLPLQFTGSDSRLSLKLDGSETISIDGIDSESFGPKIELNVTIVHPKNGTQTVSVLSRIDTEKEADYYRHGGILQYVLRKMLKSSSS